MIIYNNVASSRGLSDRTFRDPRVRGVTSAMLRIVGPARTPSGAGGKPCSWVSLRSLRRSRKNHNAHAAAVIAALRVSARGSQSFPELPRNRSSSSAKRMLKLVNVP